MPQHTYHAPADDSTGGSAQPNFCPNCGHPVAADDQFCQNCGFNLQTAQPTAVNQTPQQPVTPPAPATDPTPQPPLHQRRPRKPLSKRQKAGWWTLGVVVVLAMGFGVWGHQYYSRTATLNRVIKDIQGGKHLTRDFTSASASLHLTDEKLVPLNRYFRSHPKALNQFKQQLQTSGQSKDNNFTYQTNGHNLLFFPKYQISVSPVYPTVTTNHAGTKISLDHQTIATANSDSFSKKLGALVPGEYHLQASGKVGSHQLNNSSDYTITQNQVYDLDLTTITATLATAPSSTIYLNGKKLGTADANGTYELKDEPWSDNMNVYATYKTTSGTAQTTPVKISKTDDGNSDIALQYPDMISESDADDFVASLFDMLMQVSTGTSAGDVDDGNGNTLDSYFENGTNNTDYQQLKKMADGYDSDDNINDTDMSTKIKSTEPGPNDTSLVTYTVKYTFALDDHNHVQTFQYTATLKNVAGHQADDNSDDDDEDDNQPAYEIVKISPAQKLNDYHTDEDDDD